MSVDSPLYIGAIELLAHSVELFSERARWKSKFVILHLANAVEVILKDRMVDLGLSIYVPKRPKTVDVWKAMEALETENIEIPNRPVLELLIDDRNTLQHRFGSPNERTLKFYFDQTMLFFQQFLSSNYAVDLEEALAAYIDGGLMSLIDLSAKKDDDWTPEARYARDPRWEFLYTFGGLDSAFSSLLRFVVRGRRVHPAPWVDADFPRLLSRLVQGGYFDEVDATRLESLHKLRNKVSHSGGRGETVKVTKEAYAVVTRLLAGARRALVDWEGQQTENRGEPVTDAPN